jgi:hypothetical protein
MSDVPVRQPTPRYRVVAVPESKVNRSFPQDVQRLIDEVVQPDERIVSVYPVYACPGYYPGDPHRMELRALLERVEPSTCSHYHEHVHELVVEREEPCQ